MRAGRFAGRSSRGASRPAERTGKRSLTPCPRALLCPRRMRELAHMGVADIAAHVRGGELSAREVVTDALERIEAIEPAVNAFVEVDADGALATAEAIEPGDERPFAGVPIAVKAN